MERIGQTLRIETFLAVTLGIVVLFAGKRLNARIALLRNLSTPERGNGDMQSPTIGYLDALDAILAIHASIIPGVLINEGLQ